MYDCLELEKYNYEPCAKEKNNKVTAVVILLGASLLDDPNSNQDWQIDLQSESAILIKDVDGTYDGGAPASDRGYGEQYQRVVGNIHKITANVPYNNKNVSFMNALMRVRNKGIGFVSGNGKSRVLHFVPVECTFMSKMPITEDLAKERQFQVEITWSKLELPLPYEVPLVFDTNIPAIPTSTAATNIIATGFTANWAVSVDATSYLLDVSTLQNFSTFVPGYNGKSINGTSEIITGLTTGTTYYYRVRSVNFVGASGNSNTISTVPS